MDRSKVPRFYIHHPVYCNNAEKSFFSYCVCVHNINFSLWIMYGAFALAGTFP